MKRPRSIYWVTFLILLGISLLNLQMKLNSVKGVDPATASFAQIVTLNLDPVLEIIYGAIVALVYAALIALPVDAFRRWRWRRRMKLEIPQPTVKLEDDEPDDGILPNMTRK